MRITRVAFSFFAVGFVAGTFEQAAGLGDAQRGQRPSSMLVAEAALAPALGQVPAPAAEPAAGEPLAPRAAETEDAIAQEAPAPRVSIDMGDASAAEAVVAVSTRVAALPEPPVASQPPMTAPEGSAPSRKLRPFFVLPEEDEELLVVPEPQLAERPREFILPFEKGRVTSLFNQGRRHPAIDLAGPLGTPVYATTRKQRVTFAGRRGGYGNLIVARDPQGRQHYYGHLQRITARVGALLEQGETLGMLGSTGRSTGPHVHYEVRTRAGRHLDPSKLLFPDYTVRRGYAWNTPRPAGTRLAARSGQPRPR
jgi:murein DD-endopeptidase MepM/ murein hydrolase activator NlpD